jgi:glycosyltransferase involved in cell wall biosynthesis
VSVIVPVHDEAALLPVSLGSILRQSYADFEIVVAGDGADAAVERAALSTGDPRVRWQGFPKAPFFGYSNRGRAIDCANGELIAYLAPDDLWSPDHLALLVEALDRDRLDFALSRPILVWADGGLRPHYLPFDLAWRGVNPPRALLTCVSPSHVLHTRDIAARAGGWSDRVIRHGDVDLWLRCRAAGARIGFVRAATAVRFPSYAFRLQKERLATLHSRIADDMASGRLAIDTLRWSSASRVLGWLEDIAVVGRARGITWTQALLQRQRQV